MKDHRDTAKMILGSAQTELGRRDGVAFLVMCHHPTDWLTDQDNAHDALCAYSSVQLFGHKHVQRLEQINQSVRICAGAVHPVRTEKQWTPRYNVLSLHVSNEEQRFLVIDVYQRVWSKTDRQFVKESTVDNAEAQRYRVRLSPWTASTQVAQSGPSSAPATAVEDSMRESEDTKIRLSRKRLLYHFISLPYHTRKRIMHQFGLVESNDDALPDVEVFTACFERARQRDVLDKIWDAIEHEAEKG
jgi:hypothetical protein